MGVRVTPRKWARRITKKRGHYLCARCDKKYVRTATAEWAENPYHNWVGRTKELSQKCEREAIRKLQDEPCPECETENDPYKMDLTVHERKA